MAPNHTQSPAPQATGHGRVATITDIGKMLQRKRSSAVLQQQDTAEIPVAPAYEPPLAPGEIVGYFRHAGRCIQVQYGASECLWLRERSLDDQTGALTHFDAFHELDYNEFGHVIWPHRTLQFTYLGTDVQPQWMAIPSASLGDLLHKVMSLYDYVVNGAIVRAAHDLVPNPDPQRYDPNRNT
jgi:hypothetical protein